ncbi:aminotransferase class III-fold pyridoxal phosphate-dependent enzyme, partial [Streptomyces sp. SID5910]|uniref:aminotransferase class III-fold pyridoxal phosphate-dependent enzyme n=1 Tax=Streptomyces sp. SID5910 TaxID=2690312 RepID=UPI001F017BE3
MTAPARTRGSEELIRAEEPVLAHNYHPLPVVVARAEGAWVEDVEGRRYLDMLAGYSALNFGHRHPALIEAAHRQLDRLTLTSRAVDATLRRLLGEEAVASAEMAEASELALRA